MRQVVLSAACLGLFACLANFEPEQMGPLGPTLRIVNKGSFAYRVQVSAGVVAHVYPGQSKCVLMGHYSGLRVIEFSAQGGARRYYTAPENLLSSAGWIVEIGELPKYDVLSFRPARTCK